MGNLKPGATYVYEREGGITYAREMGADPDSRTVIGHDSEALHEQIMESKLWGNIRRVARTNPTLQDALDRAIMIYRLIEQEDGVQHHSV
jgi:hypothetical protein